MASTMCATEMGYGSPGQAAFIGPGTVTTATLAEAIRVRFENPAFKWGAVTLVIIAIGLGNAGHQTGNLIGGALGVLGARRNGALTNVLGSGVILIAIGLGARSLSLSIRRHI